MLLMFWQELHELIDYFGQYKHFNNIKSSNPCLPFLCLCVLQFLSLRSYSFQCTHLSLLWLNFSPKYCIAVFYAITNVIVFFISFSDVLLLVFKHNSYLYVDFMSGNITEFFDELVLTGFWWSLRIHYICDCIICKQRQFYFFPIWMPFFFFLSHCSSQDFQYCVNNSGKSRHLCLVLDLSRKVFNPLSLNVMLAMSL